MADDREVDRDDRARAYNKLEQPVHHRSVMVEVEHTEGAEADFPWQELASFVLGLWLFASAFLWAHRGHEQTDAVLLGGLIAVVAAWAMFAHVVHYANTVLALWLFFSTVTSPHASAATTWNNVIVALIVFVLSLVPNTWLIHLRTRRARQA